MLVNSVSSKHFVDSKLIRGVGNRMMDYTEINQTKAAGHNTLFGSAQGILLVVVLDTQYICDCQIANNSFCARFRTKSIFYSVGSSKRC